MIDIDKKGVSAGCELCGDLPVIVTARCHPTAPVRIVMLDSTTMEIYCYIPDCNRLVARVQVADIKGS